MKTTQAFISYASSIEPPSDPVGDISSGMIPLTGVSDVTMGDPPDDRSQFRGHRGPPNNEPRRPIILLGLQFTGGRYPGWLNFSGLASMLGMVVFYILSWLYGGHWYLLMGLCALAFLVLGILAPRVASVPTDGKEQPDETGDRMSPS